MTHQGPFTVSTTASGVVIRFCGSCGTAWQLVELETAGEKDSDPATFTSAWEAVGEYNSKGNSIYFRDHQCAEDTKKQEPKRDAASDTRSLGGRVVTRR